MANWIAVIDSQLDELFRGWNVLSSVIALTLVLYLLYPVITAKEPDTHPMLLSRQANVSPIRQQGQSAIYRGLDVPQGYPLRTGLNVKAAGASRWSAGRDGDVRDIWLRAIDSRHDEHGQLAGMEAKVLIPRGSGKAIERELQSLNRDIITIGTFIRQKAAKRVGIYLPNSVELLVAIFAAAFYGFIPVIIPYDKPLDVVSDLINRTDVDYLITAAGALPTVDIRTRCSKIREVMLVVEETSREVDWTDASAATYTWHEVLEEQSSSGPALLPPHNDSDMAADFVMVWLDGGSNSFEIITFTQKNIVAAVGAQVSGLPSKHRMSKSDIFLPAESLTAPYMLVQTFAALFSGASIAVNSVAGADVPLSIVARGVEPTVIAVTSVQAFQLHDSTKAKVMSAAQKLALHSQVASLKSGNMPGHSIVTRILTPAAASLGHRLRLMYVFDSAQSDSPPTSSARLSELRAFTNARVVHALVTAKVAGPVALSGIYDYRRDEDDSSPAHFGVPPACLELFVKDKDEYITTEDAVRGELHARGPAVVDAEADLGILGEFRQDGCLRYLFQYPEQSMKHNGI